MNANLRLHLLFKKMLWRCAVAFISLFVVLSVIPDNVEARPRTLFDMLFGEKQAQPTQPSAPVRKSRPPAQSKTPKRAAPVTLPLAIIPIPQIQQKPPAQKRDDARLILVIGDFMARGLAEGLIEAFRDNANIRVQERIYDSSGLVRTDHYDWNKNVQAILDEEDPAVVIIMVGANDRQPISVNDKTFRLLSEDWLKEYELRGLTLSKTIKDAGYPFIWVGQVPFKSTDMTHDMLAFNAAYRDITIKNGGIYTDVVGGFADDDGNAIINGVDINGQNAVLRASDGINLSSAGKRKLAFYVEKPIRTIFNDLSFDSDIQASQSVDSAPLAGGNNRIVRIAPVSLQELLAKYPADELAGADVVRRATQKHNYEDISAPKGRADYFHLD